MKRTQGPWKYQKKTKQVSKNIDKLLDTASDMAFDEVRRLARDILKKHSECYEFVMGMGSWFITKPGNYGQYDNEQYIALSGDPIDPQDIKYSYIIPLSDFIAAWDNILHITGTPMRFTANGPERNDW